MKISLPETGELVARIKSKITRPDRIAFLSAVVAGLATHLFMFTNKLMGRDDLLCLFVNNDMVTHGRWLLKYPSALSSTFSLPLVGGVISILALAVTSVIVARLLDIKKGWQAALVSAILVTFPSVANTFSYMFVADAFFISCAIASLAAFLTDRAKHGALWGLALITVSMAIYQGYLCFMIPLLAMRFFMHLAGGKLSDREILKKLLEYAIAVVGGVVAYVLLTKAVLALKGLSLGAGQGLDSMGKLALSDIPVRVYAAYLEFFEFWFRTSMIETFRGMRYINLMFGAGTLAMLLYAAFSGAKKSPLAKTLMALEIACVPLLFNAVQLLGATSVHWVMIYGFALIYVLAIVAYNVFCQAVAARPLKKAAWLPNASSLAVCAILIVTSCAWAVNANKVYFAMDLYYENCYALVNRVVYDVEHTEEYTPGMPLAVIGSFNAGNYEPTKAGSFKSIGRQSALQSENDYVLISGETHFRAFARYFVGFYGVAPESEKLSAALSSQAYKDMPCYPAAGSCQVIDGIMLVKAAE